ncbi:helix-turn-helix domain-containing protein [Paenibacillus allorhizosphaerae]|uniref:HTH-type transcriptional activator RhaR n=1 Tax=Paenibacillus allorhizosphaerae TaxID=2849866 RepID=A0ABN7TLX6_9BACL|nr:AraC family transcriptional regulator [Paenibacillus allorhizosphaerae]CAG7638049.1 HTH-type transcriptional activator RhaR [Paenibacillus allorhizosphaerae]
MIVKKLKDYIKEEGLFWIQRSSHERHNTPPEHVHEFIELVYVVNGKGLHKIGEVTYPIHAGDIYVVPIGEPHVYRVEEGSGLEIINCMFMPQFVRAGLTDQPSVSGLPYLTPMFKEHEPFTSVLSLSSRESSAMLALLEDLLHEMKHEPPGYLVVARNKLTEILILLSRFSQRRAGTEPISPTRSIGNEIVVRKIGTYLERYFALKITVSDLAQQFNLSQRHIIRIFKQETGVSITEMLHQIRIERAKHLLLESNRSVEAIAIAVGFADSSFFSRLFARKEGCTPGMFRKRAQQR